MPDYLCVCSECGSYKSKSRSDYCYYCGKPLNHRNEILRADCGYRCMSNAVLENHKEHCDKCNGRQPIA